MGVSLNASRTAHPGGGQRWVVAEQERTDRQALADLFYDDMKTLFKECIFFYDNLKDCERAPDEV